MTRTLLHFLLICFIPCCSSLPCLITFTITNKHCMSPCFVLRNTMGAFSSKTSDSYKKSSRVRSNKCGSASAGHQPNELMELTKKRTNLFPPEVRKSTEKKSDKPLEIKKPVMNHGSNKNDFYDGIPRYQKPGSMRTKQGSEVSSRLGRAGTLGLGKAVEVLDKLGSSMTNLNPNSGFVSGVTIKGNELSILAFEVANTTVKGYSLMESVSNKNVQQLKEVVLTSEGVQHLVSKDMDELLKMVATDKREELKVFTGEVIRFGNRCKNPQWHNLDRYFEKHSKDPPQHLKEEADSAMQHFMTLVQCTAELYQELNTLDRLEQDYQHKHQIENKSNVTQKGEDLASLKVELKSQRKKVTSLKKKSLWLKTMEEMMEKLVNIVLCLTQEINNAFGSANANTESKGVLSIQRLGPAGLSLHYANIIQQIDSIVTRSISVPSSTRELLYQNLPPSIKSSFRSKLKSFHVKEELTVTKIKTEMEKTLRWLAPLATNTSKVHHGFGWVGEWASTQSGAKFKQAGSIDIIRIETLHHADKAKTDKCILELLLWLNHMSKQFKVAAKSGSMALPTKSLKQLISLEKYHLPTPQPANNLPLQCLENQGTLRDISNSKRTIGLSKSQCFKSAKTELTKHDRLSKSSGHSPASKSLDFLAVNKHSSVPVTDFGLDKESIYNIINISVRDKSYV